MSHNPFTPSQLHHLCHQYILPLGHRDSQCHSAERSLWRTPFLQPCSCNETAGGNFIGRPYSVANMPLSHWFVKLGKVFFRVVCEQIICSQVVRTADTSDETFEALMAFGKAMKKVTVSCKVWTWGHMTLSQCTLLVTWPITSQHFSSILWSSDLVGKCMTFWDKCEQAGYVEFARKRLTLVAMVPCNWLGHSYLIADGEVCSFIFIIVLLRGGLRTTVASSLGPSPPLPKGGLGTRLRTTDAMQYVKHLLLGGTTCVYFDPTAGHSWIYCEPTVGAIHGWGSEDARERCVNTSHDIICSAVMDGINAAELTWWAEIPVHVVGSCTL